jgi:hypothetical protein
VVEGALAVLEDDLHDRVMGLTGVVHAKAHLLDRIGDVRPDEGEILESPDQADRGPHVGGDLGLCVDRRGAV